MKKLFILLIFLIGLTAFSQSWKKGLIFSAPLDEWNTTWDQVNSIKGAGTDIYNVLDQKGNGRRSYIFAGTGSATIASADRYNVGTTDFMISMKVTPANITDQTKYLVNKEASGIGYGIYQYNNDLYIRFDDDSHDVSGKIGTAVLIAGTPLEFTIVFSRTGNASLYINRSATVAGTVAISTTNLTLSNTGDFVVGNSTAGSQGFSGNISMCRLFNFAGTATQAVNYSKPEYPIEQMDQGATNVLLYNESVTQFSSYTIIGAGATISGGKLVCNGGIFNAYSGSAKDYTTLLNKNYATTFTYDGGNGYSVAMSYSYKKPPYPYANIPLVGTSGTVRVNKTSTYVGSDMGMNVAQCDIASHFVGNISNITVYQIGCLLNLNAEGIGYAATTWYDRLNALSATTSNATISILPASNLGATNFNGLTSAIALTETNGLTSDITLSARIRPIAFGEGNAGRIFSNSKVMFYVNSSGYLTFTRRDESTLINSGAASIVINTDYYVVVTSTSAGVTNFYINGVLSGTANQAAGTPASGLSYYLGNSAANDKTFQGRLSKIKCWGRILTTEEILNLYNIGE